MCIRDRCKARYAAMRSRSVNISPSSFTAATGAAATAAPAFARRAARCKAPWLDAGLPPLPVAARAGDLPALLLTAGDGPAASSSQPVSYTHLDVYKRQAAGLDKLSAKELAALNAWLQQKVTTETAVAVEKAKEEGRKEVVEKNRGFFDFGSAEPIELSLIHI